MTMKRIKNISNILLLIPAIIFFSSCEDEIHPELPYADPMLVVDAWVNDKPEEQVIRLTMSQPYLDNSMPEGVTGADVTITDNDNNTFIFVDQGEGNYVWEPAPGDPTFGIIDNNYVLHIETGTSVFEASSTMNRVPEIDSISYRFEKGNSFFPDSYFAQFHATDPDGFGDTYWIKAYKNGELLNKPGEINIAYDAGFTSGSKIDGIPFVQPIRDGINPFDQDENDDFLPPYEPGDSVYVELYSISNEAFDFLYGVMIQTDRPGGFAELFAQPLANVSTNITKISGPEEEKALGFFNVAATSAMGRRLDPNDLPEED